MATQRYSVTPQSIETLLAWVKSGEIAVPEIQRPFVWDATKVRNLLDSLYQGYPVGYLIAWQNPSVRLKDGSKSSGKRILIDGQQRVTALMAALLGREVLTKDYETVTIRIAFHPVEERFEVSNPAIRKDSAWISDIATVFDPNTSLTELTDDYAASNPEANRRQVSLILERVRRLTNNHVGVINLDEDLDIETVTEIFIRVNSAGASLSQADFAMSKIAVNESHGGNMLRKAIDYFCHLAVAPEFFPRIEKFDKEFAASEFLPKMQWLKDVNDDLYDPTYTDMLRVAFTSEFRRGKLQDLVALLSGRNFETRQYEDQIAEDAFARLRTGIFNFMNKTHFDRLTMIIRSAGFVTSKLIGSQNAVNFAYILYLRGRAEGMSAADIERLVRRWYAMSLLLRRYSASPETTFDFDIRQIDARGLSRYCEAVIDAELPESFWATLLPQELATSSTASPYFLVYQAAQVKLGDPGFLSPRHHRSRPPAEPQRCAPRLSAQPSQEPGSLSQPLQPDRELRAGPERDQHRHRRQAARGLFRRACRAVQWGRQEVRRHRRHGTDARQPPAGAVCPTCLLDGDIPDYDEFLEQRRVLMAQKIKTYFESL